MKRLYFGLLLSSLCFYADALLAQVAGNALQSQQKSQRYYENNDRLNAKPTVVWAGSSGTTADFVGDTAVTLNARVMMNVTAELHAAMLGTAQIAENVEECQDAYRPPHRCIFDCLRPLRHRHERPIRRFCIASTRF